MYAIVRDTRYDPAKLRHGRAQLAEFQELHARQPGYCGTVVVDVGDGRWISVNLWEREQDAQAALPVMVPVVQRLIEPMTTEPLQLVGAGPVVLTDLTKA